MTDAPGVPIIGVAPRVTSDGDQAAVSYAIGQTCRVNGFFYVTGHGVSEELPRQRRHGPRLYRRAGGVHSPGERRTNQVAEAQS